MCKNKVPEQLRLQKPEDGTGREEQTDCNLQKRKSEGRESKDKVEEDKVRKGKRGERERNGAGEEGLPAFLHPWQTVVFVSICPSLSLSHPPASRAARQKHSHKCMHARFLKKYDAYNDVSAILINESDCKETPIIYDCNNTICLMTFVCVLPP